jgi:hypothetical protein
MTTEAKTPRVNNNGARRVGILIYTLVNRKLATMPKPVTPEEIQATGDELNAFVDEMFPSETDRLIAVATMQAAIIGMRQFLDGMLDRYPELLLAGLNAKEGVLQEHLPIVEERLKGITI